MSGTSLINLGELSKPATVLIEKISEAVGGIFKPYQIRRIAQAEAQAEQIRAASAIAVSELQQRAVRRWIEEEAKKQNNIETITSKALPELDDSATPEHIEADWITNFFDKARLISDDEMQTLWAKVLAGEANEPGTYSKRTVNYLSSLDREDARLFTTLCGFCWKVDFLFPVILSLDNLVYSEAGVDFPSLMHLDDIGLIRYDSFGFDVTVSAPDVRLSYFEKNIDLAFQHSVNSLPIGHVLLSKVGEELAEISGAKPVPGFFEMVLGHWMESGIELSSQYPPIVILEGGL